MNGFTKLFSSIVTSTIWQEDSDTCKVWITLLALSDSQGRIDGTIPGIANIANVSIELTEIAITKFLSPDKYSRSQEYEGKRIKVIKGGWQLLNYTTYRDRGRKTPEYYRDYRAKRAEKERNKEKELKEITDTYTEAEAQPKCNRATVAQPIASFTLPPDLEMWKNAAFRAGLTIEEAQNAYDNFEANGWTRGNGVKITSWRQVDGLLRYWRNNRQNFVSKNKPTESAYDQVAQLKARGDL
jgi:hypothetical protein